MNLNTIYDKLSELSERLAKLEVIVENNSQKQLDINDAVVEIQDIANRLKGAFLLVLALGSLLGWSASGWLKIKQFFIN